MITHSSNLAWRIPMDRGRYLVGYSPWGRKESYTTEIVSTEEYTSPLETLRLNYRFYLENQKAKEKSKDISI